MRRSDLTKNLSLHVAYKPKPTFQWHLNLVQVSSSFQYYTFNLGRVAAHHLVVEIQASLSEACFIQKLN